MPLIQIEEVILPPEHAANLVSQVNDSNQERDFADLAAAQCQSAIQYLGNFSETM